MVFQENAVFIIIRCDSHHKKLNIFHQVIYNLHLPDRTLTMEKTDGEIMEDNLDWEKEADMDAALDFADSF